MSQIFIAEIKTQSPFGFKSNHSFVELMEAAITFGDWISVHTNALWGGSMDAIDFVKRNTSKPILAKGFHYTDDSIQEALDHGADYVLVVDRVPYPGKISWDNCLFEIHNPNLLEGNLHTNPGFAKQRFVSNARNLRTGIVGPTDIQKYIDRGLWTCQASGIRNERDVHPAARAFIVGEHLMEFCNSIS